MAPLSECPQVRQWQCIKSADRGTICTTVNDVGDIKCKACGDERGAEDEALDEVNLREGDVEMKSPTPSEHGEGEDADKENRPSGN